LAVGKNNGDIEIWNPKGKWVHEFTLYGSRDQSIEGLSWCCKDGEAPRLFSIGGTTRLTEWDLSTGKVLTDYDSNSSIIWSLGINADQDKISLGCDDGTLVIVDISGGPGSIEHHSFLQRQDSRILSHCWNDNHIIGGCADGKLKVWNSDDRRLVATMRVDKSKNESTLIWSVIYLPGLNQIVSGDSTGCIKFWDFEHFTLSQSFKVHDADVLTLTTDLNNESVYTAGIDRKIFKFQLHSTKWVNTSNRLFHSNDIRSITSYESKNLNLLVSGGVEKNLVICGLKSFTDGQYTKLSIIPQQQHVISSSGMIVMWQDQTVKIWKLVKKVIEDDSDSETEELRDSFELVSKMTLRDDENIVRCSVSQDGTILAVGRLSTTKLFKLSTKQGSNKLKVNKLENEWIESQGSRHLLFHGEQLILITPENEIYKYNLDTDEHTELELSEISKHKIPYLESINHVTIIHSKLYICRYSAIDVIDLESDESLPFLRLSTPVSLIGASPNNNLIVITYENKLYEFDDHNQLTTWSKTNSEFLPLKFLQLNKPNGVLVQGGKVWVYDDNHISIVDMEADIPIKKKKRSRDGSLITPVASNIHEDEDEDLEMDVDYETGHGDDNAITIIDKYKSILHMSKLSEDEIIIVERPQFAIRQPPAFKLEKYRV
jgi:U3 small nucleolar RNA-associated protein 4